MLHSLQSNNVTFQGKEASQMFQTLKELVSKKGATSLDVHMNQGHITITDGDEMWVVTPLDGTTCSFEYMTATEPFCEPETMSYDEVIARLEQDVEQYVRYWCN